MQKEQMKKLDLNKLEDVYDDLADLMAEQEEINDVLGRDFQVGNYDENELMDGNRPRITIQNSTNLMTKFSQRSGTTTSRCRATMPTQTRAEQVHRLRRARQRTRKMS